MPLTITALTASNHPAATIATLTGSLASLALISSSVAVAAGMVPETMNTAEATSSDQPAKKPSTGPNALLTHAYEAPAFGSARLSCMKANVTPNMMNPQ